MITERSHRKTLLSHVANGTKVLINMPHGFEQFTVIESGHLITLRHLQMRTIWNFDGSRACFVVR